MPVALLGQTEPRLFTPPARRLTKSTSLGFEAALFAETMLGVTLLPWQKWWLIHALELAPGGGFRNRILLTLVARQNGKTELLKCLALWMLYSGRAKLVLGSAQSLEISKEAWGSAVAMAEDDPELRAQIAQVRRANGEQMLLLRSGARYKITAASRSAGRGLSTDLVLLDELREWRGWEAWAALSKTTMARPNALTVATSNAGDAESTVLNDLRSKALAGADGLAIFEWSAPDGCELDDPAAWAAANPALGHVISEAAIRSALATDPPHVMRTEVLCQTVTNLDSAVEADAWNACQDTAQTLDGLRDRVALGLDVAPDLQHATLVAAALGGDGRVRVEVVAAWSGPGSTSALRADLPGLLERVGPRALGWFPGGPAAALAADLRGVRGGAEIRAGDVPAVCQGLAESVTARRILHNGDPLLASQVGAASRLSSGDGWRFTRRGGHCDAVYALAGAVHLARTVSAAVRPVVLVARRAG